MSAAMRDSTGDVSSMIANSVGHISPSSSLASGWNPNVETRPNPSAVVTHGDLHIHLAWIDGFDSEQSYASVIIVVPDPDALYRLFAAGLRAAYGRVPVPGIPRMVRPRKRWGTVYGFSVVDAGGNWLRISRRGDSEDHVEESEAGLARGIDVAARLADAHGDDAGGLATLERMLAKHAGAPAIDRARALVNRADLAVRLDRQSLARASLDEIATLPLSDDERAGLAADIEYVEELLR
jgi:hypothetical protein